MDCVGRCYFLPVKQHLEWYLTKTIIRSLAMPVGYTQTISSHSDLRITYTVLKSTVDNAYLGTSTFNTGEFTVYIKDEVFILHA